MVPPPPMLASEHHYYELLGVPYDASDDDLQKAYRKLCVQNHCLRKPSPMYHHPWPPSRPRPYHSGASMRSSYFPSRHLHPTIPPSRCVKFHPDKQKDQESAAVAAEQFKCVNRAYKVLNTMANHICLTP